MVLKILFASSVSVSPSLTSLPRVASEDGSDHTLTSNPLPKFPEVRNPRR